MHTIDRPRVILDLCGGTGSWSKPYKDAGYEVHLIDIEQGKDVRAWQDYLCRDIQVHGILASPPCTHLSTAGNRLFVQKDEAGLTAEAVDIVKACLDIVEHYSPTFWALENPVGRLKALVPELGRPAHTFHPWYYGDPWTKGTCLWGKFNKLIRNEVIALCSISDFYRSPRLRAKTPEGFARAFFEANP
jgi:hypothetical protein